ncbi:hypothetical protein [Pseudomonas oryzihabitans]|uniref:hypothetical protein n=1 Tax=Pseudomonas oryzihabitans TaxID=47885 RepID=UPI00119F9F32|nr:hypothetical protein [Pseudomonas oryzihabitans]
MLDTDLALKLASWLGEATATALYGAGLLWAAKFAIRPVKAAVKASHARLLGSLRAFTRRLDLRKRRWIRKYRFDSVWIGREVSRGHTSQVIFLLWFGLWIIAMGLKETILVTDAPLASSPITAVLSALPMYFFEIAWIRHSGRAAELIKYRQKVRIWRWR